MRKVPLLADDFVTIYSSPDPKRVYSCTPGLARLNSGRLVASMDQGGPGVAELPGPKSVDGDGGRPNQGRIWTSDDRGRTWQPRGEFPFMHARPFAAGGSVYILGHDRDLCVIRSDDDGETWSEPAWLTEGQKWHQSACNVHHANGKVYLVMERQIHFEGRDWPVSKLAPVTMAGVEGADLTQAASWTFASELAYRDALARTEIRGVGIPFWRPGPTCNGSGEKARNMSAVGWLETNLVQFTDPNHVWHDPEGRTFYLWMRAHTGSTGMAAIAKAVEQPDGSISTEVATAPSGEPMLFVPCPGGQMRFHILFDDVSGMFWLLSSVATDSMTRPDRLPDNRFSLPNNERHILGLHYSRNCVDWCMAGVVTAGDDPGQARHYASMVIDGDDLHVLSRSGDARARTAHDTNLITFHTVAGFRELVYT
jgi:hypothetical protein